MSGTTLTGGAGKLDVAVVEDVVEDGYGLVRTAEIGTISEGCAADPATDALYTELRSAGIDVLLDDRNERPGVMFADMELIGVPHRIVVGERGLGEGKLEYKGRTDAEAQMVSIASIGEFIKAKLCAD